MPLDNEEASVIEIKEEQQPKEKVIAGIEKPSYYTSGKIETLEYIFDLDWGTEFVLGNVLKYISRYKKKDESGLEDLKKARYYLTRLIERLEDAKK